MMKEFYHNRGFTLLELMIAVLIIILSLTGLWTANRGSYRISERARNMSSALNEAQEKLEGIYDTDFNTVRNQDPVNFLEADWTFDIADMDAGDAEGIVRVFNDDNLLWVSVTVCWREAENRIVGEDINLNGSLDAGEDTNDNDVIDSPVQLIALIGRR